MKSFKYSVQDSGTSSCGNSLPQMGDTMFKVISQELTTSMTDKGQLCADYITGSGG